MATAKDRRSERDGRGHAAHVREADMAHGRTIGEQSVEAELGGTVSVWQSSGDATQVFLALGNDPESAFVYLTPAQALELAHKLAAEAGYAFRQALAAHRWDGNGHTVPAATCRCQDEGGR